VTDGAGRPPPLVPLESGGTFVANVVDLAGVRPGVGRCKTATTKQCEHLPVIYCASERRVWCTDCDCPIEAFDALVTVARRLGDIVAEARRAMAKASEALAAVVIRRAAKEINRAWGRGMAPCCPHCLAGLLPGDFAGGASMEMGREYEIARRRKAAEGSQK
jgi:hypothetical protein